MTNIRMFLLLSVLSFVFIAGCHVEGPGGSASATCTSGIADDGIACTVDVCPVSGGAYQHITDDALCAAGQMCVAGSGCVARSPECPASCDDHIGCTTDSCDATTHRCVNAPTDSLCASDEECSATAGCQSVTPPPDMGTFTCPDGRIGDAIRIHPESVTGVMSIGSVASASGPAVAPVALVHPGVIAWGLNFGHPLATPSDRDAAGDMHVGAPGAPYEYGIDGTAGGGINTMLYVDNADVVFNWSDLRPMNGSFASAIGYWVEVRQHGTWVRLPDAFVRVAYDTVGMRWSDARELDPSLRNTVAVRVVITTSGALCSP